MCKTRAGQTSKDLVRASLLGPNSARISLLPGDERFPCSTEAVEKIQDDVYHNTGSISFDNEFLVLGT